MTAASSLHKSNVTTSILPNKVLPTVSKIASLPKATCVEVPDVDDPFPLSTLLGTKISSSDIHSNACTLLDTINLLSHSFPDITRLLMEWINSERSQEINNHLIHAIFFLERDLALQILLQLKEPRALLHHVDIGTKSDKSFLLPASFSTPNGQLSTLNNSVLLDCGAGGKGYISASFIDANKLPCTPLPYQIPVYNVDGTLNKGGAINRICSLNMSIGGHKEQIAFRITDTGSSNVILGLEWLHSHDPLVNWTDRKLFFVCCPSSCNTNPQDLNMNSGTTTSNTPSFPPPHLLDPNSIAFLNTNHPESTSTSTSNIDTDTFHIQTTEESEWESTLESEMLAFLSHELSPDDDALLFATIPQEPCTPLDTRITDYLHRAKEASSGIDKYLKDFAPIFTQSGFDDLPPRRTWDHAIELKATADTKPICSKVYSLS